MSCLTKKSLFFLVLAIVCNPTFSDRTSDCIRSIHEVFKGDVSPVKHFKIALYSISEKLISSTNGTDDYLRYYEHNSDVIYKYSDNEFLITKHYETLEYFYSLYESLESSTSNAQFNLPPESKRPFVLGYFNLLIDHFDSPRYIEDNRALFNHYVNTLEKYCKDGRYITDEPSCQITLMMMLADPDQPNNNPAEMDGYQILKYCYKKFTHLDFTVVNYYPERIEDGEDASPYEIFQLATMASYLAHISDMAAKVVDEIINYGIQFPTIQDYCSASSST